MPWSTALALALQVCLLGCWRLVVRIEDAAGRTVAGTMSFQDHRWAAQLLWARWLVRERDDEANGEARERWHRSPHLRLAEGREAWTADDVFPYLMVDVRAHGLIWTNKGEGSGAESTPRMENVS
ncbi:hypothetical protein B0T11DRAFT_300723 [Plectosphaerella cucumerina]|uniref:Uncharacterized protein n=1 Tax=Plectosphaerella cucumerina TaxID=40658 RepID=A0A8K0T5K2_9PEZI|nr:hypothetical protein B0T11DRAFT_300723 [Plectosphaerella cucumerina]